MKSRQPAAVIAPEDGVDNKAWTLRVGHDELAMSLPTPTMALLPIAMTRPLLLVVMPPPIGSHPAVVTVAAAAVVGSCAG